MAAIARKAAFLFCAVAWAQTPNDVIQFLRNVASDLANAHDNTAQEFLSRFDRDMPNFGDLKNNVETTVSRWEVGSAIEIVTDSGNERKRTMELDWVLEVQDHAPRRQVVKCTVEKRGKNWKFTSFDPVDLFKN
jgi:hypothetical protein